MEYPMARTFRNQGDPLYDDLKKLFIPNEQLDLDLNVIIIPDSEDDKELEPNIAVQPPVQAENVLDEQPPQHLDAPHEYPPQDDNDFEALSLIEIIDISDDADNLDSLYLDFLYTDSDNEVFPLSSNEQAHGEVIDNIFGNVSPFNKDEVISPTVKPLVNRVNALSSFTDVIPTYTPPLPNGLRATGGSNALFSRGEHGSSSSSTLAKPTSTIKSRKLFK